METHIHVFSIPLCGFPVFVNFRCNPLNQVPPQRAASCRGLGGPPTAALLGLGEQQLKPKHELASPNRTPIKSSNGLFTKSEFQTPRLVPLDSSRNSVVLCGIYASRTPIWTRIRQTTILGHRFRKIC